MEALAHEELKVENEHIRKHLAAVTKDVGHPVGASGFEIVKGHSILKELQYPLTLSTLFDVSCMF